MRGMRCSLLYLNEIATICSNYVYTSKFPLRTSVYLFFSICYRNLMFPYLVDRVLFLSSTVQIILKGRKDNGIV